MSVLPSSPVNLTIEKVHCWCTLWTIERSDGQFLRFTDHDEVLQIGSEVFTPVGGFNSSARQQKVGLRADNVEALGVLTDDAITNEDLRHGRYREAEVTEQIVDWRYPWAGSYSVNRYWVEDYMFDNEVWKVRLVGLPRWLRKKRGQTIDRNCKFTLGDERCGLDITSYASSGTVTVLLNNRTLFECDLAEANDYWSLGALHWTSGPNIGESYEVKAYDVGKVRLFLPTTDVIAVGHTFDIDIGCGKIPRHCKGTTGGGPKPWPTNMRRFGGEHQVPGNDILFKTP